LTDSSAQPHSELATADIPPGGPPFRAEPFGVVGGYPVTRYTFVSDAGLVLKVLDLGAAVQELWAPDGNGSPANVVLGCAHADGYAATPSQYFGAVVGRFANRIDRGRFTLDGVTRQLDRNDGTHTLHGGPNGFHRRPWTVARVDDTGITLELVSADGDQGFPGALRVNVSYTIVDRVITIRYRAECDAPTIVNLTNHAHFNLSGEGAGSIEGHVLAIDADLYTPVGPDLIPIGSLSAVRGTPLDFRTAVPIAHRIRTSHEQLRYTRGYDHNFALSRSTTRPAAMLTDPVSGRALEVRTDQPGLQLYTGNFFDGAHVGTSGSSYRQGDGVALETQHFPDSPNHPNFPSTVLRQGEIFTTWTSWTLTAGPAQPR